MKLYGHLLSPYVARVILALRYKQLPFELQMIDHEGLQQADYLALNPMGKMPTLVDGDLAIPESDVILEYLDARYPDPALLPAEPTAAARVRVIARTTEFYVSAPLQELLKFKFGGSADAERTADRQQLLGRGLQALEAQLVDADGGDSGLSLADCFLLGPMFYFENFADHLGLDDSARPGPNLVAYWQRIRAREPLAGLLAELGTAMAEQMKQATAAA